MALNSAAELIKQALHYQKSQIKLEQLVATWNIMLRQLEAKYSDIETMLDLLAERKYSGLIQQDVFETLNKSRTMSEKDLAEVV